MKRPDGNGNINCTDCKGCTNYTDCIDCIGGVGSRGVTGYRPEWYQINNEEKKWRK